MNIWRKLKRFLCIGSHRSTVPTGLVPLKDLHSAVVYLLNQEDLTEPQKTAFTSFLRKYGLTSTVFIASDALELRTSSDLFISLCPEDDINERYAATASTARFKIGRHQIKRGIYDFVVTDNGPEPVPVIEALEVIKHFITNIQ